MLYAQLATTYLPEATATSTEWTTEGHRGGSYAPLLPTLASGITSGGCVGGGVAEHVFNVARSNSINVSTVVPGSAL